MNVLHQLEDSGVLLGEIGKIMRLACKCWHGNIPTSLLIPFHFLSSFEVH